MKAASHLFALLLYAVIAAAYLFSPNALGAGRDTGQGSVPITLMIKGEPIAIEVADKVLRSRVPQDVAIGSVSSKPSQHPTETMVTASADAFFLGATSCGASSQPIEIRTLAVSLKCDIDLIFEYVYNNIEYEPIFGSNKGALGTLLDQRGNDIDQVQLFVALLSAAGYSFSQINLQYGYIRINGTTAASWLGVKNDGSAIDIVLSNGGIPTNNLSVNKDGTLASVDVAHVWAQIEIAGTNYVFDPSFKQHTVATGLSNLGTILGYNQSQFLDSAGGTIDSVSISNINRANVRNNLVRYTANLIRYIKLTDPGWSLNDIVGGKTIQFLAGSPLRQTTLPHVSPSQPSGYPQNWGATVPDAYRTCFTISMPGVAQTLCDKPSTQTIKLFADETYGRRITIFSTGVGCVPSGTCTPTLLIEGAAPLNGQNTGTPVTYGSDWTVNVAIMHPYTGSLASAANESRGLVIKAGGSYLIGATWGGGTDRGMLEKHRKVLDEARAAGAADSSESILGESLSLIGYNWLAQRTSIQRLSDRMMKITSQLHHVVGIVGQVVIQQSSSQGPKVDFPLVFTTSQAQTFSSAIPPVEVGPFFAIAGIWSSLESAVLEQTQALVPGMQAASTVRLIDVNASTGAKTYFADGTTSAGLVTYFNSIRPNLTSSYAPDDLTIIDTSISTNGQSSGNPTGQQALVPTNGSISIGLWQGAGFTISMQTSTSAAIRQGISGGSNGGFAGTNVPISTLVQSSAAEVRPVAGTPSVPSVIVAQAPTPGSPTIAEPIAAITGAYLYQHADLVIGSGSFPYALPFVRNYSSASNKADVGLGNGWSSNYSISATRSSDPFAGLGETSPAAAAAAIAAFYVAQDLLSGTKTAQVMTISWLVSDWLTDQLTNNSVTIHWPDTSESFILLPRMEGETTGTYAAPLGSAVVLTGIAPDSYGNFTTFTYRAKDQTLLTFNAIDSSGKGTLANWIFPNGMRVDLSYGYSFGGATYLSGVSNNIGRSLAINYNGARVTSVTDGTGRSVSYSYDGSGNMVGFADPIGYITRYTYDGAGRMTQLVYPSYPETPFFTNAYDDLGRVSRQADAHGNIWEFYFAGSRSETADAAGNRHVTYQSPRAKILKDAKVLDSGFGEVFNDTAQQNGVVDISTNQYDGQDRLTLATAPEGGTVGYSYSQDFNHNVIQVTRLPKPGSPLSALVTRMAYDATYSMPTRIIDPMGVATEMTYDASTGNLLSIVADAGGGTRFNAKSSFTYTTKGQVLSATDPLGTMTLNVYDSFGNRTRVTRDFGRLNQVIRFSYDARGDVVTATDPNGNASQNVYDSNRQLVRTTEPLASASAAPIATSFTYDADGRVVLTTRASGSSVTTARSTYTPSGQLATATDANGNLTQYEYDVLNRVSSVRDALGRTTSFEYDAIGRRTQIFNQAIQANALLELGYTPDGLVASLKDANGNTTSHSYDGFDRLSTTTYPGGSTEAQTYDANGNVLSRTRRAKQTITFAYDSLNRLISKTPPSPAPVVSYAYDLAGRLIAVSDNSSPITAAVPPSGTTVQYATSATYDALNRPLGVSFTPAPTQSTPAASTVAISHGYNAVNQRISQSLSDSTWLQYPTGPSTTSYSANALNQYTAIGAVTPTYDSNGNLSFDGTFTYCSDAQNRLARVITSGTCAAPGTTVATYAYDAQGRRKSKTVGATTTIYVTDADNREVLEYNGSTGQIQAWYAFGNDLGALNRMDVSTDTRQTFIPDIQGSMIGTLDSSAGTLTKRGYLPFGESATTTGSYAYTGLRIDPETNGLYYARARIYAPRLGRFVEPDPIGYADGVNLYAYVGNDPLNFTDPSGLAVEGGGYLAGALEGMRNAVAGTADALVDRIMSGETREDIVGYLTSTQFALDMATAPLGGPLGKGIGSAARAAFDWSRSAHVFREALGHVNPSTLASQGRFASLFESVASNPANLRVDAVSAGIITEQAAASGVTAFTWLSRSGQQVWVTVRDGIIQNAGVNRAFR